MKKHILLLGFAWAGFLSSFAQFSFVHMSDMHVSSIPSPNSDTNAQYFQCAKKEFASLLPKPAFVLVTGDISDVGSQQSNGMYPTITQYLFPPTLSNPDVGDYYIDSAQTIPIYFTPGNHEYWVGFELNGEPISTPDLPYYTNYLTPDTDYVITTGIAAIVFLRSGHDTPYPPPPTPPNPQNIEGTGLTDAQIIWLRNTLAMTGNKRKIIVFHHPAVNARGTNSDGTPFSGEITDTADNSILNNRTNFLNICDSNHVDVVLNGHEHQNVVANRAGDTIGENWPNGTRYVQTAAAFNRSYRIITVDPSFVTVGRPMRSSNIIFGVDELGGSMTLNVFPNPASDKITIECNQEATMEILTIDGRIIKTIPNAGKKTTIDLANLHDGVYIIKAKTDYGILIRKFIKL
jgi:3',5'-cyclic AMP phosphodiesterase CpdA